MHRPPHHSPTSFIEAVKSCLAYSRSLSSCTKPEDMSQLVPHTLHAGVGDIAPPHQPKRCSGCSFPLDDLIALMNVSTEESPRKLRILWSILVPVSPLHLKHRCFHLQHMRALSLLQDRVSLLFYNDIHHQTLGIEFSFFVRFTD